jgi:hypothetical protein
MKKIVLNLILITSLFSTIGCKKYLDINTDEDTPQNPDPTSVFPTQLSGIPRGTQYDARFLGKYTQNWLTGFTGNQDAWDLQGYSSGSDNGGDIWRQTYYGLGKNIEYVIAESEKKNRWDIAGAGLALKAFMFQTATDYHGEIAFYNLYQDDQVFYKYTTQDTVYRAVDSMCKKAIDYLNRPLENTGLPALSRGDFVYNGDVNKWRKFAYGILALNYSHLSNKATYNAALVSKYCDSSLSDIAGADDFLIPFLSSKNDDANFFGTYRNNLVSTPSGGTPVSWKPSNFFVKLLDGTSLVGNTLYPSRDPRLRHLLGASQDTANGNGGYRGIDPGVGDPNSASTTSRIRVAGLWGDSTYNNPSSGLFTQSAGKYLFKDRAVHPIMTYAEIQFIKAEAEFRRGDKTAALAAYRNGIQGHMNFVNRDGIGGSVGSSPNYNTVKMTPAEISYYMNVSGAVKTVPTTLTITDIMLQKYIALWGWGFFETWCDLRRFHYTDLDPATTAQVYKNFKFPATFFSSNSGKPAYRVRPRFNSEYVWNIPELQRFGALANDYHTKPIWFIEP